MSGEVTLEVVKGRFNRKKIVFKNYTTCIIGRAKDCNIKLPNDEYHRNISRHHCLLDINPPDIRVRDFGSLNGTSVNGKKIGQRNSDQSPEEVAGMDFPEHDLKDGDEIGMSETVFRVGIQVPVKCINCGKEISKEKIGQEKIDKDVYQCETCRQKALKTNQADLPEKKRNICPKCGKDVSDEIGRRVGEEYLCHSCRNNPLEILKFLLDLAKAGEEELVVIKGYTIIKELGKGGMGAVYLARHEKKKRDMALKVMLPQVAADERAKEMFLREAENTKALKNPNVVRLNEAGCSKGTFFFTLEFCDGGSVDKIMEKNSGPLSIEVAGGIILQALKGLEYAHGATIPYVKLKDGSIGKGRGLVHRDLKPGNIFLSGNGKSRVAKVADFGLAKAFETAGLSGQTRTGAVAGTPFFMPRQQVINFKYAKPEVDVWAMAATFYTMITGAVVRDFPAGKDYWQTVMQSDAVPVRQRNSAIPRKLAKIIDEALIDRPDIQIKEAAELRRALEMVL